MHQTLFCPHCKSANIEPRAKTWHCFNCQKDFEHAQVQLPPEETPEKGGKK